MKVNELTAAAKDEILKNYRRTSVYKDLVKKLMKLRERGMEKKANELAVYLRQQEQRYLTEFCQEYNDERITIPELKERLTPEEFDTVVMSCYGIVLFSDVIDSFIANVDRVAEHHKEEFTLDCYKDLLDIKAKIRKHLDYQRSQRSLKVDALYADTMDSVDAYMEKRIRTMVKRMNKIDEQYKRMIAREEKRQEKIKNEKK